MGDEIKGAVAEAVRAVEASLSAADKGRVRDLLAAELRRVTGRLDGLAVSLDIAGLSAAALAPETVMTAIEIHVKDVKARLTEQVRLRVLAEARASEAGAKLAEAEAALQAQGERLEREKVDLCAAATRDVEAARLQLRGAREEANVAGQECERLQARLAAVEAAAEQAAEQAATAPRPAWGEATIMVDFADLCPEGTWGPHATVESMTAQMRPEVFGFVPGETRRVYLVAAAQRPDGAPLRGWGRPVGPRCSEYFVWIGDKDRLPALHIRNAPPSYTPIHALVLAMEQCDRAAGEEARASGVGEAEAEAEVEGPPVAPGPSEPPGLPSPWSEPAPGPWRLSAAFVERLPEHLRELRFLSIRPSLSAGTPDGYVCVGPNKLYWAVLYGEHCGENPAWGEGARQVIEVRRCDVAGNLIPSGDFHVMRYPVPLLSVVVPA